MASEVPQPPKVDVDELTDNDLRASATLHAQFASSLREVIRLRESLRVLETKHEISELERKLQDLEREKDRRELNTCKEKLHAVEDELQHTKCEFGELKSGRADMEQRLESAETRSKAAERLLGEYVLEAAQNPVPGPLTRIDASAVTSSNKKRARSPSLEMVGSSNSSPVGAISFSAKKSLESASSLYSMCNAIFPPRPRRSESQASCLPTPPPTSSVKESPRVSAKRRKVGTDDEVMDVENGGDFESNRPASDTAPCANDTSNLSSDVPPCIHPVTSLSSDSDRTEAPLHHRETDSMDVEATRTDPCSPTCASRLFSPPTRRPTLAFFSATRRPTLASFSALRRPIIPARFLDTSTMPPPVASMVQQYLPGSNAKILPIFPRTTEVPRAFLISAYGGAVRQWLQIFRKDKNPKGAIERRVVFPQFGLNPAMPSAPGHPGLIFASRHEILEHPPWTVFRKGSSGSGKAVWLYLGDYECELVGKMTGAEFIGLARSVKREWAKALLGVKQFEVYVSMRARIALRKHGCIPLEDKKKEKTVIEKEIESVKANNGRPVDAGDIIRALERGDERIDIIRMICIKYDYAFARDMSRKFIDYKASLASASATSEPLSSGKKTAVTSTSSSAAVVPKSWDFPVLLPNNTSRRKQDIFDEEEFDMGGSDRDSEEDSEFEPRTTLSMVPSDRKLRPRTSKGESDTDENNRDSEEDSESEPQTPLQTVPSDRSLRPRMSEQESDTGGSNRDSEEDSESEPQTPLWTVLSDRRLRRRTSERESDTGGSNWESEEVSEPQTPFWTPPDRRLRSRTRRATLRSRIKAQQLLDSPLG